MSTLSKEEVEEYGSQKTQFMYTRYGSMRLFAIILFLGMGIGLVTYKQKNVLRGIKGSTLEYLIKTKIGKNQKVIELLS